MKNGFQSNYAHLKNSKQPEVKNHQKFQNKAFFEDWLKLSLEQKNLKNHDLHLEEYEEIPEEILHPQDYRIEIERRFRNSVVNKIYIFPRKTEQMNSDSSDNSSMESMKNVAYYELSSQNYKNYIHNKKVNDEAQDKLSKEFKMGINYKQFLCLLEKTMKKVNYNDVKNIKMNNFFKKEASDMLITPHFNSSTHKEAALKHENKFISPKIPKISYGKSNKTMENFENNENFLVNDERNRKKIMSPYENIRKIKHKNQMSLNYRSPAISFTHLNSQTNTPSVSMNKTKLKKIL